MANIRAFVRGFAQNCVVPVIEPDQSQSMTVRLAVCFFGTDPAFVDEQEIEKNVTQNVLPLSLKAQLCDEIRAAALALYGDTTMPASDIIFPDLTRGI